MSTHFWDEDPRGLWTLGLENKGYYFNTGEGCVQAGAPGDPSQRGAQQSPRQTQRVCSVHTGHPVTSTQ